MPPLKNNRHERYAFLQFQGKTEEVSMIEAGFSPKWARSAGSRLSTNVNILARIAELHKEAETPGVMSVIERKETLSEIARGRLSDFIDVEEDGKIKKVDIKGAHSAALQEVAVTEFTSGKEKRARERTTKIKLHDPVRPITELNRMEHIYEERVPAGTTIVNTFMFILPGGQRVSPKQLREVHCIEGQAMEHIEAEEDKG